MQDDPNVEVPAEVRDDYGHAMAESEEKVNLYIKTHRGTGLKYFGRTTEDPQEYSGSGAYWTRHLATYGADVHTEVVGTFTDEAELRTAAETFSTENDIANSTDWANLLPESGMTAGQGWTRNADHSERIAALDAAVETRLASAAAERALAEERDQLVRGAMARLITPGSHNVPAGDRRFG